MLDNFISSEIGLIHLISAVFALIFGSFVLADTKGTVFHRRVGYLYALSMIVLNVTALLIYRIFQKFGVFHIAAIVSIVTMLAGMIPAILRRPKNNWFGLHFNFMYWSVMGLYAAFVAEMSIRLPLKTMFTSAKTFFITVAIATLLTMIVGQIFFLKNKKKWENLSIPLDEEKEALAAAKNYN